MTVQELIDVLLSHPPDDPVYLVHFEDGDVPVAKVERRGVTDGPDRGQEAVFIIEPLPKPLLVSEKLPFPRLLNHGRKS